MTEDIEKYQITIDEAMARLSVSKKTVYNRLRSGKLDGKKLKTQNGKQWFINIDEFSEQAAIVNEVVEIDREMSKEDLLEAFKEAVKSDRQALVKEVQNSIVAGYSQLQEDIEKLRNENLQLKKELKQDNKELRAQLKRDLQAEREELAKKVEAFRENEREKEGLIDKIIKLFG